MGGADAMQMRTRKLMQTNQGLRKRQRLVKVALVQYSGGVKY